MYQVDPQQASAGPTPSQSQHTEPQEEEEEGSPGPSPSALLGNGSASVHGKRKQPDSTTSDASGKKRRQRMGGGSVSAAGPGVDDGEEAQDLEVGPNGGAKHWTEEEKTRFFTWMLTSDEHWDAFRTRMNTVFREVRVLRFLPALPLCHCSRMLRCTLASVLERVISGKEELYGTQELLSPEPGGVQAGSCVPGLLSQPLPSTPGREPECGTALGRHHA